MVKPAEAWSRVSQLGMFAGRKLSQYILQSIVASFTLTTGQATPQTAVQFPAGMILLGVTPGAQVAGAAATQTYKPGLDMFSVSIDFAATNRNILGTAQAIGSSAFGVFGDQFPALEIVIPTNSSLLYSVTNLTTSTIGVTFTHHGLVPNAIG